MQLREMASHDSHGRVSPQAQFHPAVHLSSAQLRRDKRIQEKIRERDEIEQRLSARYKVHELSNNAYLLAGNDIACARIDPARCLPACVLFVTEYVAHSLVRKGRNSDASHD